MGAVAGPGSAGKRLKRMTAPGFDDIGACVFDAYGTLFDFNSAVDRRRDRIGGRADELSALWRQKQLQYTWLRSLMGRFVDFWHVTGEALDHSMRVVGIDDPALRAELMQLYLSLEAYPDARGCLERLKKAGTKTAILSNGSMTMLVSAVKNAGLDDVIDAIYSVDRAEIFKPHHSVYQIAVDELKVPTQRISFQSANGWDAHGAAAFGFRVAWINRFGQPAEALPGDIQAELSSLADLPDLIGA